MADRFEVAAGLHADPMIAERSCASGRARCFTDTADTAAVRASVM